MRRLLVLCSLFITVVSCAAPREYAGETIPVKPGGPPGDTAREKTVPPPNFFWHGGM